MYFTLYLNKLILAYDVCTMDWKSIVFLTCYTDESTGIQILQVICGSDITKNKMDHLILKKQSIKKGKVK